MTVGDLRQALHGANCMENWFDLKRRLAASDQAAIFHALFAVALSDCVAVESWRASEMLVELEPPCPIPLEDALRLIARSDLNLSNRLIPFYLLTQFGTRKVVSAVRDLAEGEYAPKPPPVLTGITYWLGMPKIELVRGLLTRW